MVIASFDEPHAALLRLAVEAGMPDVTLGGVAPARGAVSAESLRDDHGMGGVLLVYQGIDPGEDWTYSVQVVQEGAQRKLVVRCAETLFYNIYPSTPLNEVVPAVFQAVLEHNERFSQWRGRGGEVGYKERLGVPKAQGLPASKGLVDFLERRYREGRTMEDGPAAGWWIAESSKTVQGGQIGLGQGNVPSYRLGPVEETPAAQRPENRAYVASLRSIGKALMILGAVTGVQAMVVLSAGALRIIRFSGWTPIISQEVGHWVVFGGCALLFLMWTLSAGLQVMGGNAMSSLKGPGWAKAGAICAMIPGMGPLLVVSLPFGIRAFQLLRDKRMPSIIVAEPSYASW